MKLVEDSIGMAACVGKHPSVFVFFTCSFSLVAARVRKQGPWPVWWPMMWKMVAMEPVCCDSKPVMCAVVKLMAFCDGNGGDKGKTEQTKKMLQQKHMRANDEDDEIRIAKQICPPPIVHSWNNVNSTSWIVIVHVRVREEIFAQASLILAGNSWMPHHEASCACRSAGLCIHYKNWFVDAFMGFCSGAPFKNWATGPVCLWNGYHRGQVLLWCPL